MTGRFDESRGVQSDRLKPPAGFRGGGGGGELRCRWLSGDDVVQFWVRVRVWVFSSIPFSRLERKGEGHNRDDKVRLLKV